MTVYVGALAPERVEVTIDNADLASDPLDLSTVTAVTLEVRAPAQAFSWELTITSQDSDAIVGHYEAVRGGMGLSNIDRAKLKKYGAAYNGPQRTLIEKYLETMDVK